MVNRCFDQCFKTQNTSIFRIVEHHETKATYVTLPAAISPGEMFVVKLEPDKAKTRSCQGTRIANLIFHASSSLSVLAAASSAAVH